MIHLRSLAARLRSERAYTMIEMLTVMIILGTVLGALMTLFVQGSNAEFDMNNRFQAQQEARLALDKLRKDNHCASAINVSTATTSFVTLTIPCVSGGTLSWCTSGSGTRYSLYRQLGSSCSASAPAIRYADYLTTGAIFTNAVQSTTRLWKLHVDIPVNVKPRKSVESYELVDDIVLRNSTRTCVTGSPSPPC